MDWGTIDTQGARRSSIGRGQNAGPAGLDRLWALIDMGPIGVVLVLVLPLVAAALFYVWAEVTTLRLGYQLSQAGEAHRALLEENRGLRVEVAALRAPERLKRLAADYGLEPPRTEQVVRVAAPTLVADREKRK